MSIQVFQSVELNVKNIFFSFQRYIGSFRSYFRRLDNEIFFCQLTGLLCLLSKIFTLTLSHPCLNFFLSRLFPSQIHPHKFLSVFISLSVYLFLLVYTIYLISFFLSLFVVCLIVRLDACEDSFLFIFLSLIFACPNYLAYDTLSECLCFDSVSLSCLCSTRLYAYAHTTYSSSGFFLSLSLHSRFQWKLKRLFFHLSSFYFLRLF